jgi:DNA (cytosine-5)-methyltransferase 1
MNELALFAGAGGGILGGEILGWRCVCAVEIDDYARRVLMARQDDRSLPAFPIWDDVRTFDGRAWHGLVDIITGGFPCQDISIAGSGLGLEGERSGLWREMRRIVGEVEPRYVLVENSPALTYKGLDQILSDLAEMGYDARWGVLGAIHAGAPHRRERIWIVAHAAALGGAAGPTDTARGQKGVADQPIDCGADDTNADRGRCEKLWLAEYGKQQRARRDQPDGLGETGWGPREDVSNTDSAGREQQRRAGPGGSKHGATERGDWWATEPSVGRMADGVACRVDRLRCLGNGQVPAVVALAWHLLTGGDDMNIANQEGGDESG